VAEQGKRQNGKAGVGSLEGAAVHGGRRCLSVVKRSEAVQCSEAPEVVKEDGVHEGRGNGVGSMVEGCNDSRRVVASGALTGREMVQHGGARWWRTGEASAGSFRLTSLARRKNGTVAHDGWWLR
jgi:hypothetical protein